MAKPSVQSVKAELDTLAALSQERFTELLNRVKRLETVLIGSAGTTLLFRNPSSNLVTFDAEL